MTMFKSTGKGSTRRGAGQKTGARPKGGAGSLGYLTGPYRPAEPQGQSGCEYFDRHGGAGEFDIKVPKSQRKR